MSAPLLEFRQIEKAFFGVKVLRNVSFEVPPGAMLGIVGENGAGKSTLMNILGGNLAADSGSIRVGGQELAATNPREAERQGIAFIHQELNLFPNLTIAENLFLTRFPRVPGTPFIRRSQLNGQARQTLAGVGLDVSPERLLETLSPGERQLVEIAKALSFDARLILFDEPTTSLSLRETDRLFQLIATLRQRGITILYISHVLPDIFRWCDQIVVLRDGAVVAQGPTASFTTDRLISLMVGRTLDQVFPPRHPPSSRPVVLDVRGISRQDVLDDLSFQLGAGEVLGLAGLMGAGRSELVRTLFGLDRKDRGEVWLDGKHLDRLTPGELTKLGVGFLSENRRAEGLCLDGGVGDNLSLVALPQFAHRPAGWLSLSRLQRALDRIRATVRLDEKVAPTQPVRTLSGGNQQKVVLGKWLLRDPRLLILDEPTRGIDVGAKAELYRLIHDLSHRGVAILVISSELEELIGLCDRILVMRHGRWADELSRSEFDRERILRAALGASADRTNGR